MKNVKSERFASEVGHRNNLANIAHYLSTIKTALIVCAVSVLLLIVSGVVFFKLYKAPVQEQVSQHNQNNAVITLSDGFFKDCSILRENCTGKVDCIAYSVCGAGGYDVCRIYDCGDSYGIFTQDGDGNTNAYRRKKSVNNVLQSAKEACNGIVNILEEKCVDGKMQLKVRLSTPGQCKIENFIISYDDSGNQPNTFVAAGNDTYMINLDTCGTVTAITPQTEGGVPIF